MQDGLDVYLSTNGTGYEEIRVNARQSGEGRDYRLKHHRLLLYAERKLESPFFEYDMHEVHHKNGVEWDNRLCNLEALTPEEHRQVDEGRRKIRTAWDYRR